MSFFIEPRCGVKIVGTRPSPFGIATNAGTGIAAFGTTAEIKTCKPRGKWSDPRRLALNMTVKEVMSPGVECVTPETTLIDAAQMMKKLDVGPLPVCENDRLVGIVTDRDIVLRAVADGRDPQATTVRDAMTPEIVYCFED